MLDQAWQVARRCATEAIDGLILVAHHPEAAAILSRHQHQQRRSRAIGILKLVDEHLRVAPAHLGQGRRIGAQQFDRTLNQAAKIHQPAPPQRPNPDCVRLGPLARPLDLFVGECAFRWLSLFALPLLCSGLRAGYLSLRRLVRSSGGRQWHLFDQSQVVRRRQQLVTRMGEIGE